MMIEFGPKAIKFLSKSEKSDTTRIFKRIKELGENQYPQDAKKLKGETDVYRIRIGDFRVLYKIIREDDVVLVFRVDKRSRVIGDNGSIEP